MAEETDVRFDERWVMQILLAVRPDVSLTGCTPAAIRVSRTPTAGDWFDFVSRMPAIRRRRWQRQK